MKVLYYEFMPSCLSKKSAVRSPNLRLAAAIDKEQPMRPQLSGNAECPFRIAACGFNHDAPKQVFREYLASMDELVMWRYVVAGSFLWDDSGYQLRIGPGSVLATHQPAPTRLMVSTEGVWVLWVLCVGKPAIGYFDQIVTRFGRSHPLPPHSEPVRRAEALVREVRTGKLRTPFHWSEACFHWLSAYHQQLETQRIPLRRLVARPELNARLLPSLPRTVKSFAAQLGYSPAYFSRQIAKKWKDTPGRLLRELRLREAAQQLRHGSERVQAIAAKTGYSSVPAFITAFKKAYGRTPLDYRHTER